MGDAVAGDAAHAFGGDQPVRPEAHEVLAHRRLRTAQAGRQVGDLERAGFQGLDDAQAIRVRKGAQGGSAVPEDLRVERARL